MITLIKEKIRQIWKLPEPVKNEPENEPEPLPENREPESEPVTKPRFIGKVEGLTTVHNICDFIDADAWRHPLKYVLVNPSEQHIVATDCNALILVPLSKFKGQRIEGDEPFLVDGKSLQRAFKHHERENKPSLRKAVLTVSADEETVRIESFSKSDDGPARTLTIEHDAYKTDDKKDKRKFPNYQGILDGIKEEDFTLSICIDARRLKPVIDHAIATMGDDYSCLRFRFKSSEEPVHVTLLPQALWEAKNNEPPDPLATYIVMPLEPFACDKPVKSDDH